MWEICSTVEVMYVPPLVIRINKFSSSFCISRDYNYRLSATVIWVVWIDHWIPFLCFSRWCPWAQDPSQLLGWPSCSYMPGPEDLELLVDPAMLKTTQTTLALLSGTYSTGDQTGVRLQPCVSFNSWNFTIIYSTHWIKQSLNLQESPPIKKLAQETQPSPLRQCFLGTKTNMKFWTRKSIIGVGIAMGDGEEKLLPRGENFLRYNLLTSQRPPCGQFCLPGLHYWSAS